MTVVPNVRKESRGMTTAILYILASVLIGAVGQLMLKKGMATMGPITLQWSQMPPLLLRIATNPFVVAGLVVYMAGVVFWLAVLSRVDLSYAYPFASLGHVTMLAASWLLFREPISPLRLLGTLIICAGVLIVSRS
jgi:multidrug transporter EmrE-like cation transporter